MRALDRTLAVAVACLWASACGPTGRTQPDLTSTPGPGASGPVAIRDLAIRASDVHPCGNYTCAEYKFSFTLANEGAAPVDRVHKAMLMFSDATVQSRTDFTCTQAAWQVRPGQQSPLLEIDYHFWEQLKSDGPPAYGDILNLDCGEVALNWTATPPSATPSGNGQVTVELAGLLSDATPWSATAAADIPQ